MSNLSISQYSDALTQNIKDYNKSHTYVSFEPNISLLGSTINNPSSLGNMPPEEDSDVPSINMTLLDNNLYDLTTASYNTAILFSNLKWAEQDNIRNGKISITPRNGLFFNIVNGFFNNDENYFSRQYINNNIVTSNYSDNLNNVVSSNKTGTFSIEWFGYFKSPNSGNYSFELTSSNSNTQSCFLWFDDDALVNYNSTNNFSIKNFGSASSKSNVKQIIANKYYPIRIQYGQQGSSTDYSLNLNIYKDNTIVSTGNDYLYYLTDSTGPYEPIQLYFALRDDSPQNSVNSIPDRYNCYISPINTSNNYSNNKQIRYSKSIQKIVYKTISITSYTDNTTLDCSLTLSEDGSLIYKHGNDYTNLSETVNKKCKNIDTNIGINNVSINTINGNSVPVNITKYFNKSATDNVDQSTGYSYSTKTFSLKDSFYLDASNNKIDYGYAIWGSAIPYTMKYNIGNLPATAVSGNTSSAPISVNNKSSSIVSNHLINTCKFKLVFNNDGRIKIFNGKNKIVWTTPDSIIKKIPTGNSSPIVVNKWLNLYNKNNKINTMNIGDTLNSSNYLISPNGMLKLVIKNNNLVLKYATNVTNNTSSNVNYTIFDNSKLFYLYNATADEKLGRTFIDVSTNKTLQYIPIDKNGVLNYKNSYTPSDSTYNAPPYNLLSPVAGQKSRYITQSNTDNTGCNYLCNNTAGCSHYYSYINNNKKMCTINNDSGPVNYFPSISGSNITSSNLYIRDKMINSSCKYSFQADNNTFSATTPTVNSGLTNFSNYTSAYTISKNNNVASTKYSKSAFPVPSSEGACGDSTLFPKISNLVGSLAHTKYNFLNSKVEGFVPGYNANNSCSSINASSPGILSSCISDLSQNISAIQTYSVTYNDLNARIDQKYNDLSGAIFNVTNEYGKINGPNEGDIFGLNPVLNMYNKYDPIDYSGNILLNTPKNTQNIKDAYIYDIKDSILKQNNLYIVGSITAASLLVVAIIIGRN